MYELAAGACALTRRFRLSAARQMLMIRRTASV
jgi:hypothetical protein